MKSKYLFLVCVLLVPQFSLGSNSQCPEKLEGKWFCHAAGMPGDGTDETTYHQSFRINHTPSGQIASYDANYQYEGDSRYLIPVDNMERLEKIGPKSYSGIIEDISHRYFCGNNQLHAVITNFIYNTPQDYANHRVRSTYTTNLVYSMDDDNHYTVSGGHDTDVCRREK